MAYIYAVKNMLTPGKATNKNHLISHNKNIKIRGVKSIIQILTGIYFLTSKYNGSSKSDKNFGRKGTHKTIKKDKITSKMIKYSKILRKSTTQKIILFMNML